MAQIKNLRSIIADRMKLTQSRLAQLLDVSERTVERWCAKGELPGWAWRMMVVIDNHPNARADIEAAADAVPAKKARRVDA